MLALKFAMGLLLGFGLFQRDELGLGPRALSSLSMVSRSCRCHTQRTPAGETVSPRFLSWLATRTWPIPAGSCTQANSMCANICAARGPCARSGCGLSGRPPSRRPSSWPERRDRTAPACLACRSPTSAARGAFARLRLWSTHRQPRRWARIGAPRYVALALAAVFKDIPPWTPPRRR